MSQAATRDADLVVAADAEACGRHDVAAVLRARYRRETLRRWVETGDDRLLRRHQLPDR
jgi:hypothetical protein